MQWVTNKRIGFDDRWVMLIMIPVTALIIPFVFFGLRLSRQPYFTWKIYVTTLIITSAIWMGNRLIMKISRSRYPLFPETRKRLIFQSAVMLVYTFIATNVLGYLLSGYCDMIKENYPGHTFQDILFNSNSASVFCSLTVVAIYETKYFMHELQYAVEEKEHLKRESLQAQLQALKSQVNPHFLFNNLNTLCAIIPENPDKAIDFVQQLSRVYRYILEVKDEKSIPLSDEMELLHAYSFLLKTRFGDNLSIEIEVPEINLQQKIVPLSLQLLLENAIKHNIVSAEKPLKITVFVEDGNLVVRNNLQKKNQISETTGIGLQNIRNRYKLITDKLIAIQETAFSYKVSLPLISVPLCA